MLFFQHKNKNFMRGNSKSRIQERCSLVNSSSNLEHDQLFKHKQGDFCVVLRQIKAFAKKTVDFFINQKQKKSYNIRALYNRILHWSKPHQNINTYNVGLMSSTDSGVHNPRASLSRTRIKASPLPLTAPMITMTKINRTI